jgi:hypothetical protein
MRASPLAGASAQRAQIIAARAGGQLKGEKVFRGRRCPGIQAGEQLKAFKSKVKSPSRKPDIDEA